MISIIVYLFCIAAIVLSNNTVTVTIATVTVLVNFVLQLVSFYRETRGVKYDCKIYINDIAYFYKRIC